MKLLKVVAMSLLVSIVLIGCSGETEAEAELREANEDLEKELAELDEALKSFDEIGTEEVEASVEEDEKAEELVEEDDLTSNQGSRVDPAKVNETIEYDYFVYDDDREETQAKGSITINEVLRGESALNLINNNRYEPIEAAPEGYEWAVYDFSVNLLEIENPETGVFTWTTDFKVYEMNGNETPSPTSSTFEERYKETEVYEGGTASGKLHALVPIDESFMIRYGKPLGMSDIFFEIE